MLQLSLIAVFGPTIVTESSQRVLSASRLVMTTLPYEQLLPFTALLSHLMLLQRLVLTLDPHVDESAIVVATFMSIGDGLQEMRFTEQI